MQLDSTERSLAAQVYWGLVRDCGGEGRLRHLQEHPDDQVRARAADLLHAYRLGGAGKGGKGRRRGKRHKGKGKGSPT